VKRTLNPAKKAAAAFVVAIVLTGAAVGCGDDANPDAITATDLDAAAESVIGEVQPEFAEQLTVADVKADAIQACNAIASVAIASSGEEIMDRIAKPDYHPAIEAEGEDTVENLQFFTRELPYIVSIGKFFCPAEAVRANVI